MTDKLECERWVEGGRLATKLFLWFAGLVALGGNPLPVMSEGKRVEGEEKNWAL